MPWQWKLGAVSVFLAWMGLVLYIQKLPRFGIYVSDFFPLEKINPLVSYYFAGGHVHRYPANFRFLFHRLCSLHSGIWSQLLRCSTKSGNTVLDSLVFQLISSNQSLSSYPLNAYAPQCSRQW